MLLQFILSFDRQQQKTELLRLQQISFSPSCNLLTFSCSDLFDLKSYYRNGELRDLWGKYWNPRPKSNRPIAKALSVLWIRAKPLNWKIWFMDWNVHSNILSGCRIWIIENDTTHGRPALKCACFKKFLWGVTELKHLSWWPDLKIQDSDSTHKNYLNYFDRMGSTFPWTWSCKNQ